MAERRGDNNRRWHYRLEGAGADLQRDRSKIRHPLLVSSIGTDGRFLGSVRPFPGMANEDVHGLAYEGGLGDVLQAKYVSIQKGVDNAFLRGVVYLAGNGQTPGTATYNRAVYFSYIDSSDGQHYFVELDDAGDIADAYIRPDNESNAFLHWDITSSSRYIYLVAEATMATTSNETIPAFNRAYWWDWQANSWETVTPGFKARFAGIFHGRYNYSVDEDNLRLEVVDGAATGVSTAGIYTLGVQARSRKHNLRSRITLINYEDEDGERILSATAKLLNHPVPPSNAYDSLGNSARYWGLNQIDSVDFFRSVSTGSVLSFSPEDFRLTSRLYPDLFNVEKAAWMDGNLNAKLAALSSTVATWKSTLNDYSLAAGQDYYDPYLDSVGEMPRSKRMIVHNGMALVIASVSRKDEFDPETTANFDRREVIRWSSLTAGEIENFPPLNVFRPDKGEEFHNFTVAGDHVFAISNRNIYRILQNGASVSIVSLGTDIGGVGRWASHGVGHTLFVVTPSGLKAIDTNTGSIENMVSVNRVMLDDRRWASSLHTIRMGYDAAAGCLILLNTVKKEMILIWEETGAITTVEGCPWKFITCGPNPLDGGAVRAFFMETAGRVVCIDAAREMGDRTMMAFPGVNQVVQAGSTTTSLISDAFGPPFTAGMEGYRIYFHDGNVAGEWADITDYNSSNVVTMTQLTDAPDAGVQFSVAPVFTRIVFSQLDGIDNRHDDYERKVLKSIMAAVTPISTTVNFNGAQLVPWLEFGCDVRTTRQAGVHVELNEVPDQMVANMLYAGSQVYPWIESRVCGADFEVQSILCRGVVSGSEAETRQGI